jgi:uncharacterized repeat protein (TIGR01451 family)
MTSQHRVRGGLHEASRLRLRGAFALIALLAMPGGLAAAPLAGTQIGNQASATYTDSNGVPQTATSNLVITTVLPVYGVDVEQALTVTAVPASTAAFPVSVTNLGNDDDSFTLLVTDPAGGDFACSSVAIYADANGDGAPDNFTNLSGTNVGPIGPGLVATYVAACQVPGSATAGNQNTITVAATSIVDPGESDSVTDTINVTDNAVVTVTKAMSASSGAPGSGPYTVTLTYTNNGNAMATDVTLSDALDADFDYVAASGAWSAAGGVTLTDADDTDVQGTAPNEIVYDFGVTAADTVTALISQVLPGQSGTLTFQVNVAATALPGVLPNTATVRYDDDGNVVTPPLNGTSNTTFFTVTPTAGVSIVGPPPIASAAPGSTVVFTNVLTNDGDSTDTFDIRLQNSNFPSGTGFFLYRSDGVTPLINGGGDPTLPDTPPVAPGASYDVVLRVVLPPAVVGGPYSVEKAAISVNDSGVESDPDATDTLTTIAASTVDVTNPTGGAGQGPETNPVETQSTNPGTTTSFTLTVTNTSAAADNYDLAASDDSTDTGALGLDNLTLPVGWTVVFRNGGSTITNTGPIGAGGSLTITADVTVPLGAAAVPAPGQSLFFQALSPVTSALDVKHDAVIVNTVRNVVIAPDNTGQVFPGGSVVYAHTLTNNGSVSEPVGTITLSTAESSGLWASQLFRDVNGDGVLDGGDTPITGPADVPVLAPGASLAILVRVNAPPGAPVGSINTTTVTAMPSAVVNGTAPSAPDSAVDTTSVVSGNLTLQKEQALDNAPCDGSADTAYATGALSALPGTCILYRITASNAGTSNITALIVSDATPTDTTQSTLTTVTPGGAGNITEPGVGGTGTIQVDVGAVGPLTPGSSVVVEFGVQIEP